MKKILLILAILFPLEVSAIEFIGNFSQGNYILGKTEPNTKIIVNKTEVRVSKDGYFVFGIDRDRKYDLIITKISNGKKEKIVKKILKRKYKKYKELTAYQKIKLHHQNLFTKELKLKIIELAKQEQ